jgi:predicted RNA polymerase sigma factor
VPGVLPAAAAAAAAGFGAVAVCVENAAEAALVPELRVVAAPTLSELDVLADTGQLRSHHLFHAARADLLARLGRNCDAADAYRRALELANTTAEQRFLARQLSRVSPAR